MAKRWKLEAVRDVLDVGCGVGHWGMLLAAVMPEDVRVTGVDREPRYIDYARRRAASEHIDNIDFEAGVVVNLPFESGRFDVLWSNHLLRWVKERRTALKEFKRVVHRGGRIICCNFDGVWAHPYPADALPRSPARLCVAASAAPSPARLPEPIVDSARQPHIRLEPSATRDTVGFAICSQFSWLSLNLEI